MKEQLLKLIYPNYQSKSYQIEKKERNIMIEEFYKKDYIENEKLIEENLGGIKYLWSNINC